MRIIKRKKEYFYLQHSFRLNGKVMTREKYLGKQIPQNIEEMKKEFIKKCCNNDSAEKFEKIKQGFQQEWKKYPESYKDKLKEQIAIAFTYNTNAIEGSTITLDETRELIEHGIAPNKPLRDVKETEAHAKVFLAMLDKKEELSLNLILKWHREIFKETKLDIAGRIRDYNVRVGSYKAPDWQEVNKLMNEMIAFLKKNQEMNIIEVAARMHYQFEKIHPFGDGNGRIGRLIINHLLWNAGYPMVIIEYKKRKSYYRALQKEEEKFFNYFAKKYIKVHSKYLRGKK